MLSFVYVLLQLRVLTSLRASSLFWGVTRSHARGASAWGARLASLAQIEELASRLGAHLKPELAGHAGHFKNGIGLQHSRQFSLKPITVVNNV